MISDIKELIKLEHRPRKNNRVNIYRAALGEGGGNAMSYGIRGREAIKESRPHLSSAAPPAPGNPRPGQLL